MRLDGELALITGAGSGIGRIDCELFLSEGAHVFAMDRNTDGLADLHAKAASAGRQMYVLQADLSDPDACESAVAGAARALGGQDICWGNAGVGRGFLRAGCDLAVDGG